MFLPDSPPGAYSGAAGRSLYTRGLPPGDPRLSYKAAFTSAVTTLRMLSMIMIVSCVMDEHHPSNFIYLDMDASPAARRLTDPEHSLSTHKRATFHVIYTEIQ